jgi:hypothetical protein
MAKCPKCSSRKGKRFCPALAAEICPQCCGEHRLVSIPCPQDCPHLSSEFYQQKRRHERAASQGKRFVENLHRLFAPGARRQFAFSLQADIYYYMKRYGVLEDSAVAQALERLKGLHAKIFVPGATPHPLTLFLEEQCRNAARYPQGAGFTQRDLALSLETLAKHILSLDGAGGHRYQAEIGDFFGCLDFEADLDYEPLESPAFAEAQATLRRSAGGLILPP